MLERGNFYKFIYFEYGEADYGSYKGMRYRVGAQPLKKLFGKKPEDRADAKLRAYAWKEPFSFSSEEDKDYEDFEFSDAGVDEAVKWLNAEWEKFFGK